MYSQREIVTKNTNKHFLSQIWSKFGKVKITENVEFFGREKINISRLSSVKQRARIVASSFLLSCDEISSSFFYINFFNSYLQFWAEQPVYASDWKSVERFSTDSFPESELVSALFCCDFSVDEQLDPKINWCWRWSSSYAPGLSKTTLYLLLTTRSLRTPTANLAHLAVGYSTIAQ